MQSPNNLDYKNTSHEIEADNNHTEHNNIQKQVSDDSDSSIQSSHSEPCVIQEMSHSAKSTVIFDYIIVGGGIAGVCTAEMLSRSGKKVFLIEKEKQICSESSGEQHCWGQFGYLYFNLPDSGVGEACIQNVNLLLNAYPLPGNNLTVDSKGQLVSNFPNNPLNWFRDQHIFYYYGLPDDSRFNLTPEEALAWQDKLRNVVERTIAIRNYQWKNEANENNNNEQSKHEQGKYFGKKAFSEINRTQDPDDFFRMVMQDPNGPIAKDISDKEDGINLTTRFIIESHDRPMRSKRIVQSIYNRFKVQKGQTAYNTEINKYQTIKQDGAEIVELTSTDGQVFYGKKVIFTAGTGLNEIQGANVKTVLSPLLIVKPAVCDRHIVYLTPRQKYTINHLHHVDYKSTKTYVDQDGNKKQSNDYSIIGNGDAVDPNDKEAIARSRDNIIKQANEVFPRLREIPEQNKEVYFGHKTEFVQSTGERNYHFALIPLASSPDHVFAAVPGKFTLAPSLAYYIYRKFEGNEPPVIAYDYNEEESYLKSTHLRLDINGIVRYRDDNDADPDELDRSNLEVAHAFSSSSLQSATSKQSGNSSDASSVADTLHSEIVGERLNKKEQIEKRLTRNELLPRSLLTLQVKPNDESLEINVNDYNETKKDNNNPRPINREDRDLSVHRSEGRIFTSDFDMSKISLKDNDVTHNNNNNQIQTEAIQSSSKNFVDLDESYDRLPTRQSHADFSSDIITPGSTIVEEDTIDEAKPKKTQKLSKLLGFFVKNEKSKGVTIKEEPVSTQAANTSVQRSASNLGMES